jgi:hypothetical protein
MSHHKRHINLRMERWHRRCIYTSCVLLLTTGVLWLLAHYCLRVPGEFGETVHPLEPWSMKIHGAAAMITLFFIGSLLNSHIRRAMKSGRNLTSGWAMIALLSALALSGYALYYIASETSRPTWSMIHWLIGLTLPALLGLHVVLGRKSR